MAPAKVAARIRRATQDAFIAAAKAAEADTDESRWEARLKAVAKSEFGTDEITRKLASETGERVAKSKDALRRTAKKAK